MTFLLLQFLLISWWSIIFFQKEYQLFIPVIILYVNFLLCQKSIHYQFLINWSNILSTFISANLTRKWNLACFAWIYIWKKNQLWQKSYLFSIKYSTKRQNYKLELKKSYLYYFWLLIFDLFPTPTAPKSTVSIWSSQVLLFLTFDLHKVIT